MEEFLSEWISHPDWWFTKDKETDNHLINNYEHLLNLTHDNVIAQIILYDQLPRHIFRDTSSHHIILYFLKKALDIVEQNIEIEIISDIEFVFFILPLRHAYNTRSVLHKIWHRLEESDSPEIIKRFIKATYNKPDLMDEFPIDVYSSDTKYIKCKKIIDIKGDFTNLPDKFIISLSGGVDSMVLTYILRNMYPERKLTAVMIHYGTQEDLDLVVKWCNLHNIELHVRKIDEIKRETCMKYELRETFETYTRNVRYHTYKKVFSIQDTQAPVVLLGHNKDDAFENILTNITYKCKYENLQGMERHSNVDGINFIRPFLNVSKQDIIEYSIKQKIPHLPNSTPTWSQRGKIRNNIVPVLDKWNPKCIDGMFHMSDMLQELHAVLNTLVKTIVKKINDKEVILISELQESMLFWKELFMLSNCHVSHKCLSQFIERFKTWKCLDDKESNLKFMLNKNKSIFIKRNLNLVFINLI